MTQADGAAAYTVRRTREQAERLLGGVDEAWKGAERLVYGRAPYQTRFSALWDAEALYLRWDIADERPWHTMTRRDEHIWNEEVVEIFIDPDRTGINYYELEINPVNTVCDLVVPRPWPELHSDPAWDFEGLATRVVPLRENGFGPDAWTALARLPWPGFRALPCKAALPPSPGAAWRANIYRIKRPGGPSRPHENVVHSAWSPTGQPSFHVPAAFRDFRFDGSAE